MNAQNRSYVQLILTLVSLVLIGSLLGLLTKGSIDTWYATLHRSPLTPTNYVFGIVWIILYAMIATSGWLIWNAQPVARLSSIKKLCHQLLLNGCWPPLFFTMHAIGLL